MDPWAPHHISTLRSEKKCVMKKVDSCTGESRFTLTRTCPWCVLTRASSAKLVRCSTLLLSASPVHSVVKQIFRCPSWTKRKILIREKPEQSSATKLAQVKLSSGVRETPVALRPAVKKVEFHLLPICPSTSHRKTCQHPHHPTSPPPATRELVSAAVTEPCVATKSAHPAPRTAPPPPPASNVRLMGAPQPPARVATAALAIAAMTRQEQWICPCRLHRTWPHRHPELKSATDSTTTGMVLSTTQHRAGSGSPGLKIRSREPAVMVSAVFHRLLALPTTGSSPSSPYRLFSGVMAVIHRGYSAAGGLTMF